MLILLPVTVMAVIALVAIQEDRAAAEREARRRAEELVRQAAEGFDRRMGFELSQAAWLARLWEKEHLTEAALWPDSQWRRTSEQERQVLVADYSKAQAAFEDLAHSSGLSPQVFLVPEVSFEPDGSLRQPVEQGRLAYPPGWRLQLTAEQLAAWEAFIRLEPISANAGVIQSAVDRFRKTSPPASALANAEFLRLCAQLADAPAARALPEWLQFAEHCAGKLQPGGYITLPEDEWKDALCESGVPLSNLALAKALQYAHQTGASEALWIGLVREIGWAPSLLTPVLLDLAEPLTRTQPRLQPCLQALRLRWAATENAWAMADAIRQSGRLHGVTTTNFWLEFQGTRWLCLLQPGQSFLHTSRAGQPVTITNWFTQARLVSKPAVEQAFARALLRGNTSLPPYMSLAVELEGEPLIPFTSAPSTQTRNVEGQVLAQTEGRLTCPGMLAHPEDPASRAIEFESMPGRPQFTLRVALTDRSLLFAAQRRRTWLFGGLVIAAALTAAIGFAAAYRSFHRQLRLNEMKSNFVSSVSHELRAPIASVRLMAESLERGKVAETSKQQEYFHFISQECRRLSSLIENVLDFSRIEQGRKQYEFEPTDLTALTRHTLKLMEPYAAEKEVRLALAIPEPQP
ncbi:MAG TPA: HAMP domain-containing sensor histidine kinase, partial [Bacillota bacterium]|nr:HAMP domain-containing sensor histidine kinase [Bacillota bacterium]